MRDPEDREFPLGDNQSVGAIALYRPTRSWYALVPSGEFRKQDLRHSHGLEPPAEPASQSPAMTARKLV
jgi:hypothetical protein